MFLVIDILDYVDGHLAPQDHFVYNSYAKKDIIQPEVSVGMG